MNDITTQSMVVYLAIGLLLLIGTIQDIRTRTVKHYILIGIIFSYLFSLSYIIFLKAIICFGVYYLFRKSIGFADGIAVTIIFFVLPNIPALVFLTAFLAGSVLIGIYNKENNIAGYVPILFAYIVSVLLVII